jgi:hypothetical protein
MQERTFWLLELLAGYASLSGGLNADNQLLN